MKNRILSPLLLNRRWMWRWGLAVSKSAHRRRWTGWLTYLEQKKETAITFLRISSANHCAIHKICLFRSLYMVYVWSFDLSSRNETEKKRNIKECFFARRKLFVFWWIRYTERRDEKKIISNWCYCIRSSCK